MTRRSLALLGLFALSFGCLTSCSSWPAERSKTPEAPETATLSEPPSTPPGAGVVAAWNSLVLHVAQAEDRFLTLRGLRTAAMMHLAMHDALNAIDPRFEPYLEGDLAADAGASPVAAATQVAYRVAVSQFPDQETLFALDRDLWLGQVSDAAARQAGVALGDRAAERILAARENDRWNGEAEYSWHPMAPGVYAEFSEHSGTPEGFIFGAGWAAAEPFVLGSADQFMAPPPPDIDSDAYTEAFREVKSVGRFDSTERTADQTHLAMWWKEFVESSHNRLARELATWREPSGQPLDLWQAARLFALLEVSIYDGYLDVFHNKFHYNHWRPYTAIRWAANDGNPDTEPDPEWDNLHRHTYAFPSYPSAHGTACASAMTVMAEVFGEGPVRMTIPMVDESGPLSKKILMNPASRAFDSFAEAARECSTSRVYLGIHLRYDSEEGVELGRKIGEHVVANALRPVEQP